MKKYWGISNERRREHFKVKETLIKMRIEMLRHRGDTSYLKYKKEQFKSLKAGQPILNMGLEKQTLPNDLKFSIDCMCVTELVKKDKLNQLVPFLRKLIKKVKKYSFKSDTFEENILEASNSLKELQDDEDYVTDFGKYIIESSKIDFKGIKIEIRNFSASFCMVSFILDFKDKVKQKLENILLREYNKRIVLPLSGIDLNGKYAASTNYSPNLMKEKDYLEECAKIKWKFLKYVNNDLKLSTFLFEQNIPAPSYMFCKLNSKYLGNEPLENIDSDLVNFEILTYKKVDISTHRLKAEIDFPELFDPIVKDYGCYQCFYTGSKEELYNKKLTTIENELYESNNSLILVKKLELLLAVTNQLYLRIEKYFNTMMKVRFRWFNFGKITRRNFLYTRNIYELEALCKEFKIETITKSYENDVILSNNANLTDLKSLESNIIHTFNQVNDRVEIVDNLVNKRILLIQSVSSIKHEKLLTCVAILTLIFSIIAASSYFSEFKIWTVNFLHKIISII